MCPLEGSAEQPRMRGRPKKQQIAFEAIQPSKRHKSGVAVRFPRIQRWRRDKKPEDADTIETLKALIYTPES